MLTAAAMRCLLRQFNVCLGDRALAVANSPHLTLLFMSITKIDKLIDKLMDKIPFLYFPVLDFTLRYCIHCNSRNRTAISRHMYMYVCMYIYVYTYMYI